MKYEPEAWRKAYQDNGFVVVQDLLDPPTLSRMRDELTRIIENLENLPPSLKRRSSLNVTRGGEESLLERCRGGQIRSQKEGYNML